MSKKSNLKLETCFASNITSPQTYCDDSFFSPKLEEDLLKCEYSTSVESYTKKEETSSKSEYQSFYRGIFEREKDFPSSHWRREIENMLTYFVEKFTKQEDPYFRMKRNDYNYNRTLLEIFDCLERKFTKAWKCREDMVRGVLRKAIIYMKNPHGRKRRLNAKKAASIKFVKKYFDASISEKTEAEQNEALKNYLPYHKNSRIKTANTTFTIEAFASEAFNEDYHRFLENFDKVFEQDNQKKFKKFADCLFTSFKEKKMDKIESFQRPPWLHVWIRLSKTIAIELLDAKTWKSFNKTHKGPKGEKEREMLNNLGLC